MWVLGTQAGGLLTIRQEVLFCIQHTRQASGRKAMLKRGGFFIFRLEISGEVQQTSPDL